MTDYQTYINILQYCVFYILIGFTGLFVFALLDNIYIRAKRYIITKKYRGN